VLPKLRCEMLGHQPVPNVRAGTQQMHLRLPCVRYCLPVCGDSQARILQRQNQRWARAPSPAQAWTPVLWGPQVVCDVELLRCRLHVQGASLQGSFIADMSRLTSLTSLNLSNNSMDAQIPAFSSRAHKASGAGPRGSTDSVGPFPLFIRALTQLTSLNFQSNKLTGLLIADMSHLTSLSNLFLANNSLSGQIPDCLAGLSKTASPGPWVQPVQWVCSFIHRRIDTTHQSESAVQSAQRVHRQHELPDVSDELLLSNNSLSGRSQTSLQGSQGCRRWTSGSTSSMGPCLHSLGL